MVTRDSDDHPNAATLQALRSFRELDQQWKAPKGTAFRAFKRALPTLTEGRDFIHLSPMHDADSIASLRAAGRIYSSSVSVVLLTASGVITLNRD